MDVAPGWWGQELRGAWVTGTRAPWAALQGEPGRREWFPGLQARGLLPDDTVCDPPDPGRLGNK